MDDSDLIMVCQLSGQHLYSKKIQPRLHPVFRCHCLLIHPQSVTVSVFYWLPRPVIMCNTCWCGFVWYFHVVQFRLCIFGRNTTDVVLNSLTVSYRWDMIFIYPVMDDVNFDHLSEVVSAKFLSVKLVFFPL